MAVSNSKNQNNSSFETKIDMNITDTQFIAQASDFIRVCGDGDFNHDAWNPNFLVNSVYFCTVHFLSKGESWRQWKSEFHPDLAKWAHESGCSFTAFVVWNSDAETGQPTEARRFLSFADAGSLMLFVLRWRSPEKMLRNVNGKTKPFRPINETKRRTGAAKCGIAVQM